VLPQIERGPVRTLDARPAIQRVRDELATVATRGFEQPELVPLVRTDEQLDAAIDVGCREVELDWMEFTGLGKAVEHARARGVRVVIERRASVSLVRSR
jgi:hypothetical protein